ncbi:Protein Wnt [Aphelenchoides besseyi]|nr:Protein Wnt [Aphelenchoides besseyi]
MASISEGARIAYDECQFQFHKRRWNYSLMSEDGRIVGETILPDGTREAAFVHAISAAGVAHRITKDCSKGRISRCGCDLSSTRNSVRPNADGSYAYRGCSDNVHYGIAVASEFVDTAEKQKEPQLGTTNSKSAQQSGWTRSSRYESTTSMQMSWCQWSLRSR